MSKWEDIFWPATNLLCGTKGNLETPWNLYKFKFGSHLVKHQLCHVQATLFFVSMLLLKVFLFLCLFVATCSCALGRDGHILTGSKSRNAFKFRCTIKQPKVVKILPKPIITAFLIAYRAALAPKPLNLACYVKVSRYSITHALVRQAEDFFACICVGRCHQLCSSRNEGRRGRSSGQCDARAAQSCGWRWPWRSWWRVWRVQLRRHLHQPDDSHHRVLLGLRVTHSFLPPTLGSEPGSRTWVLLVTRAICLWDQIHQKAMHWLQ